MGRVGVGCTYAVVGFVDLAGGTGFRSDLNATGTAMLSRPLNLYTAAPSLDRHHSLASRTLNALHAIMDEFIHSLVCNKTTFAKPRPIFPLSLPHRRHDAWGPHESHRRLFQHCLTQSRRIWRHAAYANTPRSLNACLGGAPSLSSLLLPAQRRPLHKSAPQQLRHYIR